MTLEETVTGGQLIATLTVSDPDPWPVHNPLTGTTTMTPTCTVIPASESYKFVFTHNAASGICRSSQCSKTGVKKAAAAVAVVVVVVAIIIIVVAAAVVVVVVVVVVIIIIIMYVCMYVCIVNRQ